MEWKMLVDRITNARYAHTRASSNGTLGCHDWVMTASHLGSVVRND